MSDKEEFRRVLVAEDTDCRKAKYFLATLSLPRSCSQSADGVANVRGTPFATGDADRPSSGKNRFKLKLKAFRVVSLSVSRPTRKREL